MAFLTTTQLKANITNGSPAYMSRAPNSIVAIQERIGHAIMLAWTRVLDGAEIDRIVLSG